MRFEILYAPTQTIARCHLEARETVVAESGAMLSMSSSIRMETQAGGALSAIKRVFGGESIFRNRFTAQSPGEVLLAPALRGDMTVLPVGSTQWVIQRGAFVASSVGVDVATRPSIRGLFSGMGVFLLESRGEGELLLASFGAVEAMDLDGEMIVDTGHMVAWDSRISHEITKASSGWIASYLSGEGFVVRFSGRGRIYVQTRNPSEYGQRVGRLLPPREQ